MKKNQTFLELLYLLFISMRPLQLLKNLALFAPLLFSGFLFYNPTDGPAFFYTVFQAFLVFSITTSSIYLINDIVDKLTQISKISNGIIDEIERKATITDSH